VYIQLASVGVLLLALHPALRRRIEPWLLKRLPSRRGTSAQTRLEATTDGLLFWEYERSLLIEWQAITRVVAVPHDIYIGDVRSVYFETNDGIHFQLSEDNPCWEQVTSTMAAHLPGALPREKWVVALVASHDRQIEIYRR
jgi:hypothetical protein